MILKGLYCICERTGRWYRDMVHKCKCCKYKMECQNTYRVLNNWATTSPWKLILWLLVMTLTIPLNWYIIITSYLYFKIKLWLLPLHTFLYYFLSMTLTSPRIVFFALCKRIKGNNAKRSKYTYIQWHLHSAIEPKVIWICGIFTMLDVGYLILY